MKKTSSPTRSRGVARPPRAISAKGPRRAVAPTMAVKLRPAPMPRTAPTLRERSSFAAAAGLNGTQLRTLEARLLDFENEIRATLEGKSGIFYSTHGAESIIKGDDAEVAEKQRLSNAALQEMDILKMRLNLVRRALAKMAAGCYGLCEETEEPIGFERLLAVPWARFSVHVQERHERKLREFRVNRLRSEHA